MSRGIAIALAVLLFLPALASALSLESFDALFEVTEESVVVTYTLMPSESGLLEVVLPGNISGLSVSSNDTPVSFEFKEADKKVILEALEGEELKVSFVSNSSLEIGSSQKFFVYNFSPEVSAENMTGKLLLPEGSLLSSLAEEGSVLPVPESIASDGRNLEINWRFKDKATFFVSFAPQNQFNLLWLVLPLLGLIALAAVLFWLLKAKKPVPAPKKEVKEELDLRGLTPEEKEVVKVLHKQDEKELTQSRIKDLTGLSKVKLSRILARLEKRGVVGKRPYGNTNLVFLEKKTEKAD
jgi:uncharacterized membrane protein